MMGCFGQPFSRINILSTLAELVKKWAFVVEQLICGRLIGFLILKSLLASVIFFLPIIFNLKTVFAQSLEYPVNISNQDVLDTISAFKTDHPSQTVETFKAKMPPVADHKTREYVFSNQPKKILELQIKDPELEDKVRSLIKPVLAVYSRENTYKIVIFKHRVPFVQIDTGTILLISTGFLIEVENDDEILATIAHEVGHEYFAKYSVLTKQLLDLVKVKHNEPALSKRFGDLLALIELQCDAFSSITLAYLGYDPIAFVDGIDRMIKKFNVQPNSIHPSERLRRQVIENVIPHSFLKKDTRRVSITLKEIKEIIMPKTIQFESLP